MRGQAHTCIVSIGPFLSARRTLPSARHPFLCVYKRPCRRMSSIKEMGKEQRALCSGGLVVEVEAAVWLKLGLSSSRVEEVVDELLHHGGCVSENGRGEESGRALACRHPVPD